MAVAVYMYFYGLWPRTIVLPNYLT